LGKSSSSAEPRSAMKVSACAGLMGSRPELARVQWQQAHQRVESAHRAHDVVAPDALNAAARRKHAHTADSATAVDFNALHAAL